jgi:serine/threonine-protein kinase
MPPGAGPIPETIAHYKILGLLGSGGNGDVYLAEDPRLGRRVAIKVLAARHQSDPVRARRFLVEAQAAAKLDHPNICSVFEVGECEDGPFIVMPYVEGESLSQRLARGPLTLEQALDLGMQVLDALGEAHAAGLVHRDIKPANIMINRRDQAKVLDFGLAKAMSGAPDLGLPQDTLTGAGLVVGTLAYMSPEQLKGQDVDARTDLYSFGTVLFQMVTGRQAFEAGSQAEIISEILTVNPRLQTSSLRILHPTFARILDRALEKDRQNRYPSAKAFREDLAAFRAVLDMDGPTAQFPVAGTTETIPAARPRRAWIRPAALGAGLVLAAAWGILLWRRIPSAASSSTLARPIAVLPLINAGGDEDLDYFSDGLTEGLVDCLTHLPQARVIAESSLRRYRGAAPDVLALARDLGVGSVVQGRILAHRDTVTVELELTDAYDRHRIWGMRVEQAGRDLVALQNEVTSRLLEQLGAGGNGVARLHTSNDAFQLYLKGRYFAGKFTPEDMGRALAYFEQAIAKDPGFALPYLGMAKAYWGMCNTFQSARDTLPKAKAAAERALALDPDLGEAHAALGITTLVLDHDWARAEASLLRGTQLDPGAPRTWEQYGYLLARAGKVAEARKALDRAVELDPQSTEPLVSRVTARIFARDFRGGRADAERMLALVPDFWFGQLMKGLCIFQGGDREEGLQWIQRSTRGGSPFALAEYGFYLGQAGRRQEAQAILRQLRWDRDAGKGFVSHTHLAMVLAGLGERKEAIRELEQAVPEKDELLVGLPVSPNWDPLRGDPDFLRLLATL